MSAFARRVTIFRNAIDKAATAAGMGYRAQHCTSSEVLTEVSMKEISLQLDCAQAALSRYAKELT
jgi:hypothetical protein